jgi:CheY-like chemotaxis protein
MQLSEAGAEVVIAENGQIAVEMATAEPFDLILMDMQMPVMDGLTATSTIRAIELERGDPPIPIIALTANARPHDVALSGNAGCNQHLSKPISKHKLLSTIEEYGPIASVDAPGAEWPPLIGIEMPPGLEEIVPGYLAARQEELPEMMALLAASGFERLAALAHDIKGTCGSYGFPVLTRMGAVMEQSAKQTDAAALGRQLTELQDYLRRVQLFAKP